MPGLGSMGSGVEIIQNSNAAVYLFSRLAIILAPAAAVLAIVGMESEGSMVMLLCCIIGTRDSGPENELRKIPLIFESSLIWFIFSFMGGIDSLEWIQSCCVFSAVFSVTRPSKSDFARRFQVPHFLMFCSVSQLVLFGLLSGWSDDLAITAILATCFLIQAQLVDLVTGSIWGIFVGFRGTIIALRGGVMISDYLIIDEAHQTWIMMLSGPVLGVAIFETLRGDVDGEEE